MWIIIGPEFRFASKKCEIASGHHARGWLSKLRGRNMKNWHSLTWIIHNAPVGHSETKSKHLTRVFMWTKNVFFEAFFLGSWAISGRTFFGNNNFFSGINKTTNIEILCLIDFRILTVIKPNPYRFHSSSTKNLKIFH